MKIFDKEYSIQLKRPVVFFDLETTGVNPMTARICEISCLKIHPDSSITRFYSLVNPGIPIPEEASKINGITDDKVKDAPHFSQIAEELNSFFNGCDLGGYNIIGYDIQLLQEQFRSCGISFTYDGRIIMDALFIFRKMFPHNLTTALKLYLNENLEDAHTATADTDASAKVFFACMSKHNIQSVEEAYKIERGNNVDLSGRFVMNEEGISLFSFGKYKDKSVLEIYKRDPGYIYWLQTKFDLTTDSRQHLALIINGKEK